jgi:hypothetical protein
MRQENVLRLRIAALKLYRVLPNVKVAFADNELFDLLITDEFDRFTFAAKVGSTKMFDTDEYKGFIAKVGSLKIDSIKYPIIAISVNETTEDVKIGILTSIRFNSIRIVNKPMMVSITQENALILYDNVKAMDSVIRNLHSTNWGVIKNYAINIQCKDRRLDTAHVIYLRPFSNNYKMKQVKISNEKEKFKRLFFGIPEEEYPSDIFDAVIDKGLKQLYPDAQISKKSSLLLFNTELDDLKVQISTYAKPIDLEFIIEPNVDEAIRKCGFFQSISLHIEAYPDNMFFNGYWKNEIRRIKLEPQDWNEFYDLYKSGSPIKTDVSHLIPQT